MGDERIAVVGAHLGDAALDQAHEVLPAAERRGRETAGDRLGEAHQVGLHAEPLGRPAGGDGEAGLDLVEDEHDAVLGAQLAHPLEVAGLGHDDADVHHGRLHDEAGDLRAPLLEHPLEVVGVVERHYLMYFAASFTIPFDTGRARAGRARP